MEIFRIEFLLFIFPDFKAVLYGSFLIELFPGQRMKIFRFELLLPFQGIIPGKRIFAGCFTLAQSMRW